MGPISEIGIAFFCRYGWSPVAVGAGARAPLADAEAEAPPPALIDIIWLLGISAIGPTIQPTCRVRLGQQPAGQVVLVPSRHDEDDRSSRPLPQWISPNTGSVGRWCKQQTSKFIGASAIETYLRRKRSERTASWR